jgi:diamine N-acetyltransferase
MHPELIIRDGIPADAERLAVLAAQVWLHTYATDGISPAIAGYVLSELSVGKFQGILAQERSPVLVAEVSKNIVGYALVKLDSACPYGGSNVELASLYVQAHFVRRSIGSSLLREVRRVAQRRAGSAAIWLMVNAQNWPAKSFYEKHGFAKVGIAYFALGGEKYENHVLVSAAA